jgi:hypothetical protein
LVISSKVFAASEVLNCSFTGEAASAESSASEAAPGLNALYVSPVPAAVAASNPALMKLRRFIYTFSGVISLGFIIEDAIDAPYLRLPFTI